MSKGIVFLVPFLFSPLNSGGVEGSRDVAVPAVASAALELLEKALLWLGVGESAQHLIATDPLFLPFPHLGIVTGLSVDNVNGTGLWFHRRLFRDASARVSVDKRM